MAIDTVTPRSRRALLVGALGGLAASGAAMLRAPSARAGVDGDLVLETTNNTDAQTELIANTGSPGLRVLGNGIALQGWGDIGVDAYGQTIGVNGISDGTSAPATLGLNRANSVGVFGWSVTGSPSTPTLPAKTGVMGIAEQDANARGVFGKSAAGHGVRGEATTGDGVWAEASQGRGLVARSTSGAGIDARSGSSYGVVGIATGGESEPANDKRAGVYGSAGSSPGVHGRADGPGVLGESFSQAGVRGVGNAIGVDGESTSGIGVQGTSDSGAGVYASNASASVGSVVADGGPGTAVHGHGGGGAVPASPPTTGVYGSAAGGAIGVYGKAATSVGVRGEATSGIGVKAVATTGLALDVGGRVAFSRSGRANVPAKASSIDVTVPGGLSSSAIVFAQLQLKRGSVHVLACRPNYPSAGKVRITLSGVASTTAATPVGWWVLG